VKWTKEQLYDHVGMYGPSRVVINSEGEAVSTSRARKILKCGGAVPFDVVFVRDDGWSVGAMSEFEDVARKMWEDCWIGELRRVVVDGVNNWVSKIY
jgi:hypothetical protein